MRDRDASRASARCRTAPQPPRSPIHCTHTPSQYNIYTQRCEGITEVVVVVVVVLLLLLLLPVLLLLLMLVLVLTT